MLGPWSQEARPEYSTYVLEETRGCVKSCGSEMKQETKEHSKNTVCFFTFQFLLNAEGIFFLFFVEVLFM